jgi:hypothetical protein
MIAAHIEIVLLVTGLMTAGASALCLAPAVMMKMLFGQAPSEVLGLLIVRHWGLLIGLVGALLVYAAYHAEIRAPTLIFAIAEKAVFVFGVFISPCRRRPMAIVMALADASMAGVYLIYLVGL